MRTLLIVALLLCHSALITAQFSEETVLLNNPMDLSANVKLAADFNGDGKADYLFASSFGKPDFLLLSSGSGYEPPTFFETSYDLSQAVVADFEQDGDLDIFTAQNGLFFVWLNDGAGNFQLTYRPCALPNFELLDLDHDGDLDAVSLLSKRWLRNAGNYEDFSLVNFNIDEAVDQDIDGFVSPANLPNGELAWIVKSTLPSWAPAKLYFLQGAEGPNPELTPISEYPNRSETVEQDVFVFDVDSDGDDDIITVSQDYYNTTEINLLTTSSEGIEQTKVLAAFQQTDVHLMLLDLDNDGRLDIVYEGETKGEFSGFVNNGDGTFTSVEIPSPDASNFSIDQYRNYLDYNAPLLLRKQGPVVHAFNAEAGQLKRSSTLANEVVGRAGFVSLVDLNSDGNQDITSYHKDSGVLSAYYGTGDGSYLEAIVVKELGVDQVLVLDMDGDEDLDLLTLEDQNGLHWLHGDGFEDTLAHQLLSYGSFQLEQEQIQTIDFDRDGHMDLLAGLYLLYGNGVGQFASRYLPSGFFSSTLGRQSNIVDVDANGYDDMLQYSPSTQQLLYSLQDKSGHKEHVLLKVQGRLLQYILQGHFDRDQLADLVIYDAEGPQIVVLLQTAQGPIATDSIQLSIASFGAATKMVPMHLNNDGLHDLVINANMLENGKWQLSYLLNEGDGKFSDPIFLRESEEGANVKRLDLNSDGLDDIVYQNYSGSYMSYYISQHPTIAIGNGGTVLVHPNPTQDYLYIPASNSDLAQEYQIFDLMGSLISSGNARGRVDVSGLGSGIYLISWIQGNGQFNAKFIRQ